MNLISANIPNLVGGVSQQPDAIRRENQFEAQTNAYATLVEGLGPRRPTMHVDKLLDTPAGLDTFWHFINRDLTERYVVQIANADLKVFDLVTGEEKTVTFPDGKGYLDAGEPRTAFKAITVSDYTFIVNTGITVAMSSALTDKPNPEAVINVKQGNYGKTYAIYVNGSTAASYSTPDGSSASHSTSISTDYIAGQLVTGLSSSLSGWTVAQYGSCIHIRAPSSTDFTLATNDGFSGLAMIACKDTIQRFTDLPRRAPIGFTIAISGDKGVDGDDYYLRFTTDGAGNSAGVWKEAVKPGIKYQFDTTTMPHQLVRQADGSFTFEEASWGNRTVGDENTNPEPSFVGQTINDVFFSRNRLGFVAGENAVSSCSGSFFKFWRKTVTVLVDDDPVDVAVASVKVAKISWAIPFNKTLVLFAERGQHELGAADVLTPKSAAIVSTTEYEASKQARPAGTGTSVFFAVEQDGYGQIREYYVDGNSAQGNFTAYNTTEQCPRYIPAGIHTVSAAQSEDVVVALTTADPTSIYAYRYFGPPGDRPQSSWCRWEMGGTVLAAEFIKADLYIVIERDEAVWLERIPLAAGKKDPGVNYLTYLDRRTTEEDLEVSYDEQADTTTFTLPYPAEDIVAVARYRDDYDGAYLPGQSLIVESTSGYDLTIQGDARDTPLYFGKNIETTIVLSKIFPRENRSAQSRTTIVEGRLQLRYLTFMVGSTSSFRVVSQAAGRSTASTKVFNGRVVGASTSVIGEVPLYSGKVRIPILGRGDTTTITIIHDSHLPMNILAMEWEGLFSIRSQRGQ